MELEVRMWEARLCRLHGSPELWACCVKAACLKASGAYDSEEVHLIT